MDKEGIAFRKMALLMKAASQVNRQDEALDELKAAAFEVLLLHPGIERSQWTRLLVTQYGSEVIDAFGRDAPTAYASLDKLWLTPYRDENSGLERTYQVWAEAFSTEAAVQMYYDMTAKES